MTIKDVIKIWTRSIYSNLMITSLPVLNYKGEICKGITYSNKEDDFYLKLNTRYANSILEYVNNEHDILEFKVIFEKEALNNE